MQFFYDLLNIRKISERFFKDVKLPRKIENTWFCISDKNINNSIRILEDGSKSCYMIGNKKFKFFNEKKPIIYEFCTAFGSFVNHVNKRFSVKK